MSNYTQLYWLTRLDNIQHFIAVVLGLSMAYFIGWYIARFIAHENAMYISEEEEVKERWAKYKKPIKYLYLSIVCGIVLVFLPTKTDLLIIYAGGKTMDYVQSDTSLQKIPYQTTKIISDYLDEKLKEAKK